MEKGKNVAVYCGSRYGINPAHTAFAGMAGELFGKKWLYHDLRRRKCGPVWVSLQMPPWQPAEKS